MYFSEIEKCIFSNCEMYLSKIVKCICLKLQNVFVFYCNTNVFVQNGGMYLFQIAKCTCLKLQNLFVKKFLVFMQIGIWSVLLAHLWTAFQSCYYFAKCIFYMYHEAAKISGERFCAFYPFRNSFFSQPLGQTRVLPKMWFNRGRNHKYCKTQYISDEMINTY